MLRTLSIKSYALIDEVSIDFQGGFTVITGETGSGKSILLGALGLILGNRADSSAVHESSSKCVVEGVFDIKDYKLEDLFEKEDLDYNETSIFRREVLSSGKSRAFINDTPVSLSLLKTIGSRLVDIHSQHDVLMLKNNSIQLAAIDSFAKNSTIRSKYLGSFNKWRSLKDEYKHLKEKIDNSNLDKDYIEFQLKELEDANLKVGERMDLENELKKVENSEDIKVALSQSSQLLNSDEGGILNSCIEAENILDKIKDKAPEYLDIADRIKSVRLELSDISTSLDDELSSVDIDPSKLDSIRARLDVIYRLESKHRVSDSDALIELMDSLSLRLLDAKDLEEKLNNIESEISKEHKFLKELATKLSESRSSKISSFEKKIKDILSELSMKKASIKVAMNPLDEYTKQGKDSIKFSFSANVGVNHKDLSKVASGGELSRVMLAIKSILADSSNLPVLIFDEIDTGISGKVAGKVALVMKRISTSRQVFSITHQAQVASLGDNHYKISKSEIKGRTTTNVEYLQPKDRILEIAEMISGDQLSEHSIANATELLGTDDR